jgi:hypothetical protein
VWRSIVLIRAATVLLVAETVAWIVDLALA